MSDGPAANAPPGVIPNYDNPPNDNGLAITVIIASISITTMGVLLRVYAKVFCTRQPFFVIGTSILITIPRDPGFFVHQWDLRLGDVEKFIHAYVLSTTLYCVTLLLAKAAILLEWSHVFVVRSNHSWFYWTCYAMIAASTTLYLTTIITANFACQPRERIWRWYTPGTCININVLNTFLAVFHLIFDILMLVLPQRIIWKLQLATRYKIGVSVAFSGNLIACVLAAGRVASAVHLGLSEDATYAYSQYIIWGLAEVATAQLVFCVPTIPIVIQQTSFLHRFYSFLFSKMAMPSSLERLASNRTVTKSPRVTDPRTTSNTACTMLESGSGGGIRDQGITVTTEIDITMKDKTGSTGSVRTTSLITPWRG
ncbi:hypothetical protein F5Y09DRAFT_331781 [Xylaria sp. FL1042]|nr:hypothetical protein F5Y09DRAFT_331781 [Xylaria sp. FL1042]